MVGTRLHAKRVESMCKKELKQKRTPAGGQRKPNPKNIPGRNTGTTVLTERFRLNQLPASVGKKRATIAENPRRGKKLQLKLEP